MIGLTGYTVLLAVSACFLIRVGQVWDDVRSMLLLVVLMFLAISVSFDDTLAGNPSAGTIYFLGGLAFAVMVSEALLFGMPRIGTAKPFDQRRAGRHGELKCIDAVRWQT